jgi:putative flippase GtrA
MRIFKYFFVGGASALIDILLFSIFAVYLDFPWVAVSIASFTIATGVNYYLSIKFVFKSGSRHKRYVELIGVFIVSTLALLVNQTILYLFIVVFGFHLLISKMAATGMVFLWNYYGRSKFVF